MKRNAGFIVPMLICGLAAAGAAQAQDWGPEDDDGYDQYRAEPDRRVPPKNTPPKPVAPQKIDPQQRQPPAQPQRKAQQDSVRGNFDPLDPNRPRAAQPRQAKPARPPLAQDPSILSDQDQRELQQALDNDTGPSPVIDPPRRKARHYIPLEPALPPSGESDQAFASPPPYPVEPQFDSSPTPQLEDGPPPVYVQPTRIYGYGPPYYVVPPQYYAAAPYGYAARRYYSTDIYVYAPRGRRR